MSNLVQRRRARPASPPNGLVISEELVRPRHRPLRRGDAVKVDGLGAGPWRFHSLTTNAAGVSTATVTGGPRRQFRSVRPERVHWTRQPEPRP